MIKTYSKIRGKKKARQIKAILENEYKSKN